MEAAECKCGEDSWQMGIGPIKEAKEEGKVGEEKSAGDGLVFDGSHKEGENAEYHHRLAKREPEMLQPGGFQEMEKTLPGMERKRKHHDERGGGELSRSEGGRAINPVKSKPPAPEKSDG